MRALEYSFREAASSLWRGRGSSVFAIVAIALAMLVLGGVLLITSNIERLIAEWSSAAEFSVYLRDDATSEQRGMLEAVIDQSGVAEGREYVSKAQALARFRRDFAELASLTSSFNDNPFPASVEVRVRPDAQASGRAEALVGRLAAAPGVADVRYDREWLARVTSALEAIRGVGFAVALVMVIAAALTVATVVRLALHARRDELEIMQLVGSPYAFIRGPFVAEGLLQGGLGALLALGALWAGFSAAVAWWGGPLSEVVAVDTFRFLPAHLCAWLVAGGMTVGCLGGLAAARTA
ncbi:MAG: cell division protein FtsX [Steroidobacteraceae bacterium]